MLLYKIADILFVVFHTSLILFILFGWIWRKTRMWNLVIILLTAGSWTILGIFYGFGYCPLTDWHFNVLVKLGHSDLPASYVKYLVDRITGLNFTQHMIDQVTLWGLIAALLISLYLNLKQVIFKARHKNGA
jgi:hypothetical protein